jgi:hypothetical protein
MGEFKFKDFEIVRIQRTPRTVRDGVADLEGAILSPHEGLPVTYAVAVYDRDSLVWTIHEDDLEATGRHDRYENFYDGTRITVSDQGELLEWHDPPSQPAERLTRGYRDGLIPS